MEQNQPSMKRRWVIKVGVVFFLIMFLLTFFSNTIYNYSLPEVKTASANQAKISASVKGTGNIVANKQVKILGPENRVIKEVPVSLGDHVKEGTVLAVLEPLDEENKDLVEAQRALEKLLEQYEIKQLEKKNTDFTEQNQAIADAKKTLGKAQETFNKAQGKAGAVDRAKADVSATSATLVVATADKERVQSEYTALEEARTQSLTSYQEAQKKYEELLFPGSGATDQEKEEARLIVEQKKMEMETAEANVAAKKPELDLALGNFNTATDLASKAEKALAEAEGLPEVEDAQTALTQAQRGLESANKALEEAQKNKVVTDKTSQIQEKEDLAAIADARKKVDDLTKEYNKTTIVASKEGLVVSINLTVGQTLTKDQEVVVIDILEAEYRTDITFPVEKTKELKVGQIGKITSYSGFFESEAPIVSIKVDPTNPTTSRIVTFELVLISEADSNFFPSGEISISLINKTQNYDAVIPSRLVKEDDKGSYVLVLEQKSSPLGMRYTAVKVPVTILAKDDNNVAIEASVLSQRPIIVQSSAPLEDGKNVRLFSTT